MNRYKITIPYSYTRHGDVTGYFDADSEEEAREEADAGSLEDEEYDDGNYSGESEYDYNDMKVELEEEDIDGDDRQKKALLYLCLMALI